MTPSKSAPTPPVEVPVSGSFRRQISDPTHNRGSLAIRTPEARKCVHLAHKSLDAVHPSSLPSVLDLPPASPFLQRVDTGPPRAPLPSLVVALQKYLDDRCRTEAEDAALANRIPRDDVVCCGKPLTHLTVHELTYSFLFLTIVDLVAVSKTCSGLRSVSSSDVVWREALWARICRGRYSEEKCTHEQQLAFAVPELYQHVPELGWKAAYIKYKTPPRIPPSPLSLADLQVLMFTGLNVADVSTDLMILVGYEQAELWVFFGLSLASIIGASLVLCYVDWNHNNSWRANRWNFLANLFQVRSIMECVLYFKKRWTRWQLTGQLVSEHRHSSFESEPDTETVNLVKLFEGIFESAPQILLQNYTLVGLGQFSPVALISVFLSLISLSAACSTLSDTSWKYKRVFMFCFVLMGISLRLICYAVFAATFGNWFFLPAGVFIAGGTAGFLMGKNDKTPCQSFLMSFMSFFTPVWFTQQTLWALCVPSLLALGMGICSLTRDSEQPYIVAKSVFVSVTALVHSLLVALAVKRNIRF